MVLRLLRTDTFAWLAAGAEPAMTDALVRSTPVYPALAHTSTWHVQANLLQGAMREHGDRTCVRSCYIFHVIAGSSVLRGPSSVGRGLTGRQAL